MILHQVVIRKDGPIHAVHWLTKRDTGFGGRYARYTLCGLHLSVLTQPKRRRFANDEDERQGMVGRCGRCVTSYRAQAS